MTEPLCNNTQDEINKIINEITCKATGGCYIYRGESLAYSNISSNLYREYDRLVQAHKLKMPNIEEAQRDILDDAKKFTKERDEFKILCDLQHFGGKTNLIDFTKDYHIALFFACSGCPEEDGRVILKNKDTIRGLLKEPQNPQERVACQKSIFVQDPRGFIEPDSVISIPGVLKPHILEYLRVQHNIAIENIYRDLHGFIRILNIQQGAQERLQNGREALDMECYDKAIDLLTESIELRPYNPEAFILRGLTYLKQNNYTECIDDCTKAIEQNARYIDSYNNRGTAYACQKEYDPAIEDFTCAIGLDDTNIVSYNNRGRAYACQKTDELANKDFATANRLKKNKI